MRRLVRLFLSLDTTGAPRDGANLRFPLRRNDALLTEQSGDRIRRSLSHTIGRHFSNSTRWVAMNGNTFNQKHHPDSPNQDGCCDRLGTCPRSPAEALWILIPLLGAQSPTNDVIIRSSSRLVQVNVVAHDGKGTVANLTREDFAVFDRGAK
jgi:hypothetical protein